MESSEALMNISPFLSVDHSCDEAWQWTKKLLLQAGLRPIQTFDLHTALVGLQDCPCPNHGKNECDCQMVVVLVYGSASEPATLILHGNDGQTWLSIVNNSLQHTDASIRSAIERALQLNPSE
ncbi:MAG: hypothetical protein FJZ86_18110 [Chloroflexi bacterium]|nr:hypothetical protein [Chloroflexota bacterium]